MAFTYRPRRYVAVFLILVSPPLGAIVDPSRGLMTPPLPLFPSVTGTGINSWVSNQAALALTEKPFVSASLFSRFGINELSVKSLFMAFPAGNGAFGLRYSGYGFSEMMFHSAGISAGMKLSPALSLGVDAGIEALVAPAAGNDRLSATAQAGLIWNISESAVIGLHLINPHAPAFRDSELRPAVRAGAGTLINDNLSVTGVIEKRSGVPLSLATGIEYDITPSVMVRTGFETVSGSFGLAVRFRFAGFISEFAFVTHNRLGISPGVVIGKSFGK